MTPRSRSKAWKPLRVSRPAGPPAKRVVKTMPLSDNTRCGYALVSDRLLEGGHDCRPGHRLVAGDRDGVAGVVVDKAQDLHIGIGGAVGSGQPVVGEVGLPHLVGLFGGEPDMGRFRFLLRLRG